jgi:hypothetical protein
MLGEGGQVDSTEREGNRNSSVIKIVTTGPTLTLATNRTCICSSSAVLSAAGYQDCM